MIQDHLLAINPGTAREEIQGLATVEPAFGLQARWIKAQERERAQLAGYTLVDPATVLATHLTEIIKSQAYELLGRQETKSLLDTVAKTHPKVVEDLVPKILSIGEVQKVLQNLLKERVSIRDAVTILETLADFGGYTKNIAALTEYCRQALGRSICKPYQTRRWRSAGIHRQPGSGKEHWRRSRAFGTGILSGIGTSPGQRNHDSFPPHG